MVLWIPKALAVAAVASTLAGSQARSPEENALSQQLQLLRSDPESAGRLGAEARLLHYLAASSPEGPLRDQLQAQGLAVSGKALRLNPSEPSALLWWCAHRGSQATPLHPFEAVKIAKEVETALLKLHAVAPDYEHFAADRVLGHLYQVAPPLISLGSMQKAEAHFRSALEGDPTFPANALFFAEFLAKRHDRQGAKKYADQVLDSPELARYPLDSKDWVIRARRLLESAPRELKANREDR